MAASLISFPSGAVPAGFNTGAQVEVLDGFGAARSDASVTMNGVVLAYNMAKQEYEGDVVVAPGDSVNVNVTLDGVTYSASGKQFTSYPAISAPMPGARWASSVANVISWSGGTPVANAAYAVGILDKADPNGSLIWPPQDTLDIEPINKSAVSVPAGSVSFGNRLAIVGIATVVSIPNLDPNSGLIITGFSAAPFVSAADQNSSTLLSIAVFPSDVVIGKGAMQQFTAIGTYSDGNHVDLTTQVAWTSSDPAKATVDAMGSASGVGAGPLTFAATLGSVSGSVSASVVPGMMPGPKYPNLTGLFPPLLGDTAIGDLNGDGRNDVAVIGFLDSRILVYYQNAQGGLDPPQEFDVDLTLKGIAIADVNNDGGADLVVAGISKTATTGPLGRIAIFYQDAATHTLPATPRELTLSTDLPIALVVADLNHDSLPDIASAGQGTGGNGVISLFFQQAGGALAPEATYTNVPVVIAADHGEMHVADMNGDGFNDIVVQSGPLQLAVVRQVSLAPGTFASTPDFYAVPSTVSSFNSFALGDLNGDGRTDVATVDYGGSVNVLYQDVNGVLNALTLATPQSGSGTEVHIADLDGDGLNEIVVLNFGNNVRILYQAPDHSFRNPLFYNLPTNSTGGTAAHQVLSMGDVTNDGLADIIVSWSFEGIYILQRLP